MRALARSSIRWELAERSPSDSASRKSDQEVNASGSGEAKERNAPAEMGSTSSAVGIQSVAAAGSAEPAVRGGGGGVDQNKYKGNDEIKMDVSFCHKCDLLFISKDEFLTHRMLNCTRKFTCQTCGTMFSRVQLLLVYCYYY